MSTPLSSHHWHTAAAAALAAFCLGASSIANCQIELKDNPVARRTLDELVKAYPQSDAAAAGKERLARFR